MKLFLVAILCALAVSAFADLGQDYGLYEDAGILEKLLERVRERLQQVLNKIKDLVEKHKPVVENIKEKLTDLQQKIKDLASKTGDKLRDALAKVRTSLGQVLRDVISKISKKEEDNVSYILSETVSYALAETEEDGFTNLGERLRQRLQRALDYLKNLLIKHKEIITDAIKTQVANLKEKISQLAKEEGPKLLEKAKEIHDIMTTIIKNIYDSIGFTHDYALYAAEEEEESFFQGLKRRITERLQEALQNLKEKVAQVKSDVAEKLLPKIEEIRQKIAEIKQKTGDKLIEAAGVIRERIREILGELRKQVLGESYSGVNYFDIEEAIVTLRNFFSTDEGVAALKANAAKANPTSPTGVLIKTFVTAATPDALKELVRELFKGVTSYAGGEYQDIRTLVKQASAWMVDNVSAIRQYAAKLETNHPVVSRLKTMLESATDDAIKAVIKDIFTLNDY